MKSISLQHQAIMQSLFAIRKFRMGIGLQTGRSGEKKNDQKY